MSTREDMEDGIRVGLEIAIKALEDAAAQHSSQEQKNAMLRVADGLLEVCASLSSGRFEP